MIDAALARRLVGAAVPASRRSWTADDVILYHLGVGADERALHWVYERDLVVLPAFAATVAHATGAEVDRIAGAPLDRRMALHGEQEVELHGPLPVRAETETTGAVVEVRDLGRSALVRIETRTCADGVPLFTTRFGIVLRGAGGFGGERASEPAHPAPDDRPPDVRLRAATSARQAAIYRLSGDRNPLHVDPEHARAVGFDRPILHGLSTYGTVLRAIVDGPLGGHAERVTGYGARFSGVVFPGETLLVDVWEDDGRLLVRATAAERGTPVLTHAVVTLAG